MIVLGLDTTGPHCSACLVHDQKTQAYLSEKIGRGHAERLAPMVATLFEGAKLTPSDVDRVAVCTGPGSFTGLRVALSFAKGFALPRRLHILGFDALHVRANQDDHDEDTVSVFRDVRRGEVFAATYRAGQPLSQPKSMSLEQAKELSATLVEADGVDVRVMARLSLTADPLAYPAEPLYARAPDAKLPGGLTL